ncbi:uncharacterized protein LOC144153045 [Haemaphysalis longicornis]
MAQATKKRTSERFVLWRARSLLPLNLVNGAGLQPSDTELLSQWKGAIPRADKELSKTSKNQVVGGANHPLEAPADCIKGVLTRRDTMKGEPYMNDLVENCPEDEALTHIQANAEVPETFEEFLSADVDLVFLRSLQIL